MRRGWLFAVSVMLACSSEQAGTAAKVATGRACHYDSDCDGATACTESICGHYSRIHPVMTSKLDDGVSCDIGYCKDGVCMDAFGDP
jgi:hypothetical protein